MAAPFYTPGEVQSTPAVRRSVCPPEKVLHPWRRSVYPCCHGGLSAPQRRFYTPGEVSVYPSCSGGLAGLQGRVSSPLVWVHPSWSGGVSMPKGRFLHPWRRFSLPLLSWRSVYPPVMDFYTPEGCSVYSVHLWSSLHCTYLSSVTDSCEAVCLLRECSAWLQFLNPPTPSEYVLLHPNHQFKLPLLLYILTYYES